MATLEGNRKIAENLKEKYGVDAQGRSIFHRGIGALGGENSTSGYFRRLKAEDPEKLKKIAIKGGKTKRGAAHPRRTRKQVK